MDTLRSQVEDPEAEARWGNVVLNNMRECKVSEYEVENRAKWRREVKMANPTFLSRIGPRLAISLEGKEYQIEAGH